MKVVILKASDSDYIEMKEINTLNDLKQIDYRLIINFNVDEYDKNKYGNDICAIVTIYDYYVE